MHSDATRLDDPKLAFDRTGGSQGKKFAQSIEKDPNRGRSTKLKDDDAGCLAGWKTQNVTEIAVQRYQCAGFHLAGLKNRLVDSAAKALLKNRLYIVALVPQEIDAASADVFIGLDPHGPTETGMTCSRAASAP